MKKLRLLTGLVILATSLTATAQGLGKNYKGTYDGNPISPCVFCADPTALVFDGRVYVYGTNDSQQFISNGKKGENNYGSIKSLVIFSSADMVNWTFHGTIDVAKLCSSWGWRFANSWAPSVTWRVGDDGRNEFFLYFANSGGSVGMLKAYSPVGPWTSPLTKPLIDGDTPGVKPCNWIFDPGVVIDEEGNGWLAFGGGDPNNQGTKLMPNNACIIKLKKRMSAFEGSAVKLPAPYMFEASELNIMNGKFVYTFNTSWSDRNDWNSYPKRGSYSAPSSCSMCYMVSDTPMDPDSWQYKGEYLANPGTFGFGYGNNHTHLQKFEGNYYLFYHNSILEQKMQTGASGFRSIGVDKATVNENTQQISKVSMTTGGPQAIKNLNPFVEQQAETMATAGGISYESFTNITKAPSVSNLGNDASQNLQVSMTPGSWTMLRSVDFGEGAQSFTLKASGTGKMEIRFNSISALTSATIEFSSTGIEEHTIPLDANIFKGVKKVFFVFTEANNVKFDAWQFSESLPVGIEEATVSSPQQSETYTISGVRLQKEPAKGIYIKGKKKYVKK